MNETDADILKRHDREIAENRHGLNNHRQVIDIQLKNVVQSIEELKSILKWAGGLIITLMLSFMSWAALQQYNANEAQKTDIEEQIELLRQQKAAGLERDALLDELRNDLGPSGTISTDTPRR